MFTRTTRRMPEFTAPGLGRESNVAELDVGLGSVVSPAWHARRPFEFDGTIGMMKVRLGK